MDVGFPTPEWEIPGDLKTELKEGDVYRRTLARYNITKFTLKNSHFLDKYWALLSGDQLQFQDLSRPTYMDGWQQQSWGPLYSIRNDPRQELHFAEHVDPLNKRQSSIMKKPRRVVHHLATWASQQQGSRLWLQTYKYVTEMETDKPWQSGWNTSVSYDVKTFFWFLSP